MHRAQYGRKKEAIINVEKPLLQNFGSTEQRRASDGSRATLQTTQLRSDVRFYGGQCQLHRRAGRRTLSGPGRK